MSAAAAARGPDDGRDVRWSDGTLGDRGGLHEGSPLNRNKALKEECSYPTTRCIHTTPDIVALKADGSGSLALTLPCAPDPVLAKDTSRALLVIFVVASNQFLPNAEGTHS